MIFFCKYKTFTDSVACTLNTVDSKIYAHIGLYHKLRITGGVHMAMDYVSTSKKIVEGVGGADNIASATHCMTRLRLILKDETKANDDAVKAIKGVKSVIKQGGQYQVVIGNEVASLFKEFKKLGNFSEDSAAPVKAEGNPIQRLFGFVAGCLTPLLPAMLGTGMVKVLLTLLTSIGVLSTTGPTYTILYSMADSFFYFMPILLGWGIAKKTGHSIPLYMVIGAALVYPNMVSLMAGGVEGIVYGTFLGQPCTYLFGFLPVIGATYTSSVLPMLLMTPVMGWAEDFADRVSPNVLKAFLKPMIFLLICTPVVVVVLGPLGAVIGNGLAAVITKLYTAVPWLTVGILSALMPFIVMTGMHYALMPLFTVSMSTLGYDVAVLVTMFCSNLAQGGASLGVAAKTKDIETRSEGIACGISALVAGVTEPAMYGINMRFVKPMIAAVIGAGASGLLAGLSGVKAYSMGGSPSLMSLITFIGGESPFRGVIWGAICAVLSIGLSFFLTLVLFKDEKTSEPAEEAAAPVKEAVTGPVELVSPMTGKNVPLSEVPDDVFADGTLGLGAAILPTDGHVYAPCDAEVTQVMDSGHAIGLQTDRDIEILIHVGLDTVMLEGKPFKYNVKMGQKVKKGDLLLTADLDMIKEAGKELYTPVLITNSDDYDSVTVSSAEEVKNGDPLITVE